MADNTTKPIVVGVDGSPSSLSALEWAAQHAELTKQPLEALATWQWPTNYGYAVAFEANFDPAQESTQMLDEIVAKVQADHPSMEVRPHVIEGDTRNVLVKRSKEAALLVLGSRGHGELTGMLLGSVSGYCVTHADCPVLVTRH